MKIVKFILILILFGTLSVSYVGCIKSSVIGKDILKDDEIGVDFINEFDIVAKTIPFDSLIGANKKGRGVLLGSFSNNVIGEAQASCYFDFSKPASIPKSGANSVKFDSVVLTVFVDTSLVFSKEEAKQHIEVFELDENLPDTLDQNLSTDLQFEYNSTPIGVLDFNPLSIDSSVVIEPGKDTLTYFNQLRIRLDDNWGKELLKDTSVLIDQEKFRQKLKGIYLKSISDISSMITMSSTIPIKIEIYYTEDNKLKKMYFTINNTLRNFYHDYTGSEAAKDFNNEEAGQERLFLQGMQGMKIDMKISGLDVLQKYNVNKAKLNVYCKKDENLVESIPERIIVYYVNDEGKEILIDDMAWDASLFFFGGLSELKEIDGVEVYEYTMNITTFIKKMVGKKYDEVNLVLFSSKRLSNPGFGEFYGTKHEAFKPKLTVIYTEIN